MDDNILYVTDTFKVAVRKACTVLEININDVEQDMAETEYKGNSLKLISTALEEQRQALAVLKDILARY